MENCNICFLKKGTILSVNIEQYLILLKGKDRTEDISYCTFEGNKWLIRFNNNGKIYPYRKNNVQYFYNPIELDPNKTLVYESDQFLTGINKIMDFKEYVRIIFQTGFQKVVKRSELIIEESRISDNEASNTFHYFKSLANALSLSDEEGHDFISKQFEKMIISPRSVLAKYLTQDEMDQPREIQVPIFPFGFNLSQKSAALNALSEQLSVIEGPPGTGKTQTILNIIANAIMDNKTIAVVSSNNAATANVAEKLQKYGLDFIAAYLGNNQNKKKFFENQPQYPDMTTWLMEDNNRKQLQQTLNENGHKLEEMLRAKNELALLKQERSDLLVEKEHFRRYYSNYNYETITYKSMFKHNKETVLTLWLDCLHIFDKNESITLKDKFKHLLRYGIYSFSFYNHPRDKIIATLQKRYYDLKDEHLKSRVSNLTNKLEKYQFDDEMKKYSEDSMRLFKATLAKRFTTNTTRKVFNKESLWKDFDAFIKEYPIILSTTHSLRSCSSQNYLFDYVIMDEASQVDIVTGAFALSCAKNSVIVGDLKQLPNVVPENIRIETDKLFQQCEVLDSYHYAKNSMLSSITTLYKAVSKTLLKEHYRCHPKIIGFCNQKFYNNELIVMTEENDEDPLVVYKTAKGNHARGTYNQRQIDVILEEVLPNQVSDHHEKSVGIVTPYRKQTDKIQEVINESDNEVDTVHKYQGREKDMIILSTVVNKSNDFVGDPHLINVAVSRAVEKLIVVASDNIHNDMTNLGDLVRYIEYHNFDIIDSEIYSVFDLLYSSYSERLLDIMKKKKNVSQYESENLMHAIIEKMLDIPEFNHLSYVMHQPLRMLIRDTNKLNEEERRYAMNILTHTDFLIFSKVDKRPVLVVEVDGYAYHEENPKQAARDRMKDAILKKYEIPIIRLKTNESREEERLRSRLGQVLGMD